MALSTPPLSVYVHLPWCVRKCPYCDFNSHRAPDALPVDRYVDALLRDLDAECDRVAGRPVVSVFFGGGTPSLFPPVAFARVIDALRTQLCLTPDAEITMEANPGTLEHAPFAEYVASGINRLSIGVQSFDDAALQRIGRIHGAREARNAVARAVEAGFAGVNLDLMFGLPGQSPAEAQADVRQAIDLGPGHISHYQLTIEPNTLFHARPPRLPDDDRRWEMQGACQQQLAEAGYRQYEVSAYARPGHQCRHNLNYWRFGDYLGIGAGAHGKLTDPDGNVIVRTVKARHPRSYMTAAEAGCVVMQSSEVAAEERAFEFALNALRLVDGFSVQEFEARTGLVWNDHDSPWRDALQDGWLDHDGDRVTPTEQGRNFLDDLLERFLPGAENAMTTIDEQRTMNGER